MKQTGIIKRLIKEKGFGFVKGDSDPEDFGERFFHEDTCPYFLILLEGMKVVFDNEVPTKKGKGPRACNVSPV